MPEDKFLKQAAPGMNAEVSSGKFPRRDTRDTPVEQESGDGRNSPRFAVSVSAEVVEPRSRTRSTGRVTDLSIGGCYVDMISPFAVGTEVYLRTKSETRVFQTQATVLYATQGMGMGLAFTKMPPEQLEILSEWMGELGRESPPTQPVGETIFDFEGEVKSALSMESVREILGELVAALARKRLLTDQEADELQKKLSRSTG